MKKFEKSIPHISTASLQAENAQLREELDAANEKIAALEHRPRGRRAAVPPAEITAPEPVAAEPEGPKSDAD